MNEVNFILLSALFLSVPLGIKYWIAFQTRHLLYALRTREKEVSLLTAQAEALDSQKLVMRRAVNQITSQGRQAQARRELLSEKVVALQRRTPPVSSRSATLSAQLEPELTS